MAELALDAEGVAAHAGELLALQHAAYAVEARLIGDDRIPPLHETRDELVAAGLNWLLELGPEEHHIVGALGYRVELGGSMIDIDRLIVAPTLLRKGIGARLVHRALELAPKAKVSTGRDNWPARALYERLGFAHVGDVEVISGLWVSNYLLR